MYRDRFMDCSKRTALVGEVGSGGSQEARGMCVAGAKVCTGSLCSWLSFAVKLKLLEKIKVIHVKLFETVTELPLAHVPTVVA